MNMELIIYYRTLTKNKLINWWITKSKVLVVQIIKFLRIWILWIFLLQKTKELFFSLFPPIILKKKENQYESFLLLLKQFFTSQTLQKFYYAEGIFWSTIIFFEVEKIIKCIIDSDMFEKKEDKDTESFFY